MNDECRFLSVVWMHHDLIVARESIHEGQEFISGSRLDEAIDMWEWVTRHFPFFFFLQLPGWLAIPDIVVLRWNRPLAIWIA